MARVFVACALAALITISLSACSGSPRDDRGPGHGLYGGTLRVGSLPLGIGPDAPIPGSARYALDPQFEYYGLTARELYRCCLLRTLVSYGGRPSSAGGADLRPDLAASMPTVSNAGRTWTFHLKHGLYYAPPFHRTEITAGDVVRALEREFRLGKKAGYPFYYTVIEGTRAYAHGDADSISGLEVPDRYTLVIHLTHPTGDLDYRFALPATAPIPPGADRGHDSGYGRFLVSSGPYMIAGSRRMDFSRPPNRQHPASGWVYRWARRHGKPVLLRPESLTLVRNPSWSRREDKLRGAYADRIEVVMGRNGARLSRLVERNRLDVLLGTIQPSPTELARYRASNGLRPRLHAGSLNDVDYVNINTAQPPFDDAHVRRAAALALNKAALLEIRNSAFPTFGVSYVTLATHALPDSLEDGLLASYDPLATPGHRGNLDAARAEMARSRYDSNGDGRCDVAACTRVVAYGTSSDVTQALGGIDREIEHDLAPLGIALVVRHGSLRRQIAVLGSPRSHVALMLWGGWAADFPDASTFAPILERPQHAHLNTDFSLLGATREQLRSWGYRTESVPNVDRAIESCQAVIGSARPACWAELDQRLMERVVPYVPWSQTVNFWLTSARVARYSFDQSEAAPALDRIALRPEAR